jgi:uncharacterized protein YoxC
VLGNQDPNLARLRQLILRVGLNSAPNIARGEAKDMAETKDVKAALQRELAGLVKARDELRQQVTQAKNDVVGEWKKIETTWQAVEAELKRVGEQTREPVKDLQAAARNLLGELRGGIDRIKAQMIKAPPPTDGASPTV